MQPYARFSKISISISKILDNNRNCIIKFGELDARDKENRLSYCHFGVIKKWQNWFFVSYC